jgi:Putative zinc-finger
MNAPSCRVAYPAQTLTGYWLGELDSLAEAEFEEHLFGCAACTERLQTLGRLGEGVRRVMRDGNVRAILTAPFVKHLQSLGVRVREYQVQAGGSVECTVTPQDDLVLAHLRAPLRDVQRLDLIVHDLSQDTPVRIEDVAFDPTADEVVMLPNTAHLREATFATLQVKLLAVEPGREHVIGEYTFNHSPAA